jgi:hypothetical protein
MNFLLMLIGVFLLFLFLLGFGIFVFIVWSIYSFVQKRKRQRAYRLSNFHKRLKYVLAELLKQVNEIDQVSKYSGIHKDPSWAKKYATTLKQLLEASEKLNDAGTFIEMKEYNAAQEMMLLVTRSVHITHYRMREIVPKEDFSSLYKMADAGACASAAKVAEDQQLELRADAEEESPADDGNVLKLGLDYSQLADDSSDTKISLPKPEKKRE